MPPSHSFQSPRGTRDFYPIEMARRRWIEDKWRRTAVRHGFSEIDGPTFEHLNLYTVKSGEGIVSELFSFRREGGETDFALRPEFTPTLARMVAAKANALPKPIKWFSIGPYFRAERPQRGRLREFLQWNCDVLGDDGTEAARLAADADCIGCCIESLRSFGLSPQNVRVKVSNRDALATVLTEHGIAPEHHVRVFGLLDTARKMPEEQFTAKANELNIPVSLRVFFAGGAKPGRDPAEVVHEIAEDTKVFFRFMESLRPLKTMISDSGIDPEWIQITAEVVRGLAYYTGTVFEVHETTGAERAIAGGGRYDNLVELFGGPPTPAVGFAMGDVVLALVLQDKGLMPPDDAIARDLGLRPDVYVLPGADHADALIRPLVARLRREGLHARSSAKSTRNVGKLLREAADHHARYALILLTDSRAKLKNLDDRSEEIEIPLEEALAQIKPPSAPSSP